MLSILCHKHFFSFEIKNDFVYLINCDILKGLKSRTNKPENTIQATSSIKTPLNNTNL